MSVVGRAVGAGASGTAAWLRLHHTEATAYETLWDLDNDPDDLARSIAAWRTVHRDEPDPTVQVKIAELLHSGAVRTGDASGLPEAVSRLNQAIPSIKQPGPVWRQLAETHLLHWQLARVPGSPDAAARCLDHALAAAETADDVLAAHTLRVVIANEMLQRDVDQDSAKVPISLDQLHGALDEAGRALDGLASAAADRRAFSPSSCSMANTPVLERQRTSSTCRGCGSCSL
ncbi:hypothetical protein [Micromonospora citrea]|uniref:hypothetical protein n=1 Tax=Micromonospora citrea TaxID=47855 RepID=UPI003C748761